MEHLTRRHLLQLAGATGAGVAGASALGTPASLAARANGTGQGRRTGIRSIQQLSVPLIGMSAPVAEWDAKAASVGPGIGARRIFADLATGPGSQLSLVRAAHAAGQLPVVSYKAGGRIEDVIAGRFDAAAAAAAAQLAAFDKHTAVTFWHEPHGNMTPEQYVAASMRLVPIFKRGGAKLKVGPLLNGWLLDRQPDLFAQYAPDALLRKWDWFGFDTYEGGTVTNPGPAKPAGRIPAARQFLASRGYDLPLGIGEYNGYSAQTITDAGNALLDTENVWFGCLWNTTGERAVELADDRLVAFRGTLEKARARRARRRKRL